MSNEIQFLGMLTVQKNGAQVSFPQNTKVLSMTGNNMVQQPQLIPVAGAALNLGLVSGAPAKLMIKNNSGGFGLSAVAIAAGGTGYAVNDLLPIPGGVGTVAAVAKVTAISGGGGTGPITAASIYTYGDYSTVPTTPSAPTTSGAGTGASLTLTFAANNIIVYGDAGFTQAQDKMIAGDFIMRSPSSANLYLKPTNGPVYVLTVACEP